MAKFFKINALTCGACGGVAGKLHRAKCLRHQSLSRSTTEWQYFVEQNFLRPPPAIAYGKTRQACAIDHPIFKKLKRRPMVYQPYLPYFS
jgi:hypothetical protein